MSLSSKSASFTSSLSALKVVTSNTPRVRNPNTLYFILRLSALMVTKSLTSTSKYESVEKPLKILPSLMSAVTVILTYSARFSLTVLIIKRIPWVVPHKYPAAPTKSMTKTRTAKSVYASIFKSLCFIIRIQVQKQHAISTYGNHDAN